MTTFNAFEELWWFYLCRIHQIRKSFDRNFANAYPDRALQALSDDLLGEHPIYHRSIWFLAAISLLAESGEGIPFSDGRISAVIDLVREISRDRNDKETWRHTLVNRTLHLAEHGITSQEVAYKNRTRIFSQYVSLIEEFHGSNEGRLFYVWASARDRTVRMVVTRSGDWIRLPSKADLESSAGNDLSLFIGSGLYLRLLARCQQTLKSIRQIHEVPASFCDAMWAFQADSLFDGRKIGKAVAYRKERAALFATQNASSKLDEPFELEDLPSESQANADHDSFSEITRLAHLVANEDLCHGSLVREFLFGRAREEMRLTAGA